MFRFSNEADDKVGKKFYHFANKLYTYSKDNLGFDKDIKVVKLISDPTNAEETLGKTAYYDPSNYEIVLYSDGRHLKDILRSFSHELVHHYQNCAGKLSRASHAGEGYAQKDPELRNAEKEAYLKGNMIFRDWEDQHKSKNNKGEVMSEDKKEKSEIWALDPYEDLSTLKHKRQLRFEKTLKKFGFKFDYDKLKFISDEEEEKNG